MFKIRGNPESESDESFHCQPFKPQITTATSERHIPDSTTRALMIGTDTRDHRIDKWLTALHDEHRKEEGGEEAGQRNGCDQRLLDHLNRGLFLSVEKDYLTVRYKGMGSDSQDVGVIRANMPLKGHSPIEYFEVAVLSGGGQPSPDMAIGVSTKSMVTTRHVGYCSHSWGYSAMDGCKYHHNSRYGQAYGPHYDEGDVVGCGVNWIRREMFFTHNGRLLGTAFTRLQLRDEDIYPTISLHKNGERVRCNFRGPFVFQRQLEGLVQIERHKLRSQVDNTALEMGDVHSLVEEYLLHEGYSETLQAFKKMTPRSAAPVPDKSNNSNSNSNSSGIVNISNSDNTLVVINDRRKALGKLVLDGQIQKTLHQLPALLPDIDSSTEPNSISLLLKLHCQCFVEYIRDNHIDEAVNYAMDHLYHYSEQQTSQMSDSDADHDDDMSVDGPSSSTSSQPIGNRKRTLTDDDESTLLDTLGLLAYPDPMQSPVRYLMSQEQRRALWHDIQQALISYYGISPASRIEKLMQQLVSVKRACAEESAMGISNAISDD